MKLLFMLFDVLHNARAWMLTREVNHLRRERSKRWLRPT